MQEPSSKTPTTSSPDTPHSQPADAVLNALGTTTDGLDAAEARSRLTSFGHNRLPGRARQSSLSRFLRQFQNVLIHVLLAAAIITFLLGHWLDGTVILGVVIINAIIGFLQEGKAERALDAIHDLLSISARVLRNAARQEIPAETLVPGDLVFVSSGDKVPADIRLLEVSNLRVDEAALTGESQAVEKDTDAVAADAPLGDRHCMIYSGTLVTYGQATGVVTGTGAETEIGRINALLSHVEALQTPLLRKMTVFGRRLSIAILLFASATFALGLLFRDFSAAPMFLAAVGLAVAAIPEGLPAVMTITLALGVQQMAKRHAIIRRLPAVEALGSVTVICSDKTGTLTRNEMTAQQILTASGLIDVSGNGYAPEGSLSMAGQNLSSDDPTVSALARCAMLCNEAQLHQDEQGDWQVAGDPTEGALMTLAMKAGLQADALVRDWPRVDVVPFESEHRLMATLHRSAAGSSLICLKGAPERILPLCDKLRNGDDTLPIDADALHRQMHEMAANGMRLLALAERDGTGHTALDFADIETGRFTLLGIAGLTDPPRTEAIAAVASCQRAGIRVVMITGDHGATASAVARQVGLAKPEQVLTGPQLEDMDDLALEHAVAHTDVFARASPEHKLRLVNALQARGHIVAMTGDGVNDAPALKRADIGIAMGHKGTAVAREAAEIVLADDNFASIVSAVEEGRTVYDNLRKAIVYILPTSGGQAGMIFIAILLGLALPVTTVQILWVNMLTAVTLSLALAFEKPEAHVMTRAPRQPDTPLLDTFMLWRIAFVSLLLVSGSLGLFLWHHQIIGASLEVARTIAVNALMVGEAFYLFACRSLTGKALTPQGLVGNRHVIGALATMLVLQLAFTYLPVMQTLFDTRSIGLIPWLQIVLFGLILLLVVEMEKALFRLRRPTHE